MSCLHPFVPADERHALLLMAATLDDPKIARTALLNATSDDGFDVDFRNIHGSTALQKASRGGFSSVVALLLRAGANPNLIDRQGCTALMWAAQNGKVDVVRQLLSYGSQPTISNKRGQLPIHRAAMNGRSEVVRLLVESATSTINAQDADGWTAAHQTAINGHAECLQVLAQLGADLNVKAFDGNTPLHLAAGRSVRCLEFILDQLQLKSQPKNVKGECPVHIALREGNVGAVVSITKRLDVDLGDAVIQELWRGTPSRIIQHAIGTNAPEILSALVSAAIEEGGLLLDDVKGKESDSHQERLISVIALLKNLHLNAFDSLAPLWKKLEVQLADSGHPGIAYVVGAMNSMASIQHDPGPSTSHVEALVKRHTNVLVKMAVADSSLLVNREQFSFILESNLAPLFSEAMLTLSLEKKIQWLRERVASSSGSQASIPALVIDRTDPLVSSCKQLLALPKQVLQAGSLSVSFAEEVGVGPGVVREWFEVASRSLFDPNTALFTPASDGTDNIQPNPNSSVNADHLQFFEFAGRLIALALVSSTTINIHFTPSFLKLILGCNLEPSDLEGVDPEFFKSLQWLLDHNIEEAGLEVVFTAERSRFGEHVIEDLIPGGANTPVTESNKHQYVALTARHRMLQSIQDQVDAFSAGFFAIVDPNWIRIFTPSNLDAMLCGVEMIDVDAWELNTEYTGGFDRSSKIVRWFWEIVRGFKQEERGSLLQFMTGSSRVPLGGFGAIRGVGGEIRPCVIARVPAGRSQLPTSSTCFNLLKLSEGYSTLDELCKALRLAILWGGEGFGLR